VTTLSTVEAKIVGGGGAAGGAPAAGITLVWIVPAVLFWRHEALLIASAVVFVAVYVWLYAKLVRFRSPRWLRRRVGARAP